MFPEKAIEMKKMVIDYIKILQKDHFLNSQDDGIQKSILNIDDDGYPIAPRPQSGTKLTRAQLEPMYRLYIARHYRKSCYVVHNHLDDKTKFLQSSHAVIQTGRLHSRELPRIHRNSLTPNICRPAFR